MIKFYKTISVIFHPIVLPTIGTIFYFLLIPNSYNSKERLTILSLIFVTTYLIPVLILILFKRLKLIQTFNTRSIKERKIPVALMIVLFYLLGNTLIRIAQVEDIGLLFYATSCALAFVYFLFAFDLKTSIHLLSFGIFTSFYIILGYIYQKQFAVLIIITLLLSGLVANARLHLKAHTNKEVYIGFFIGFISPILLFYCL